MKIDHKEEIKRNAENIFKILTELSEQAWLHGIEITEVRLKDNFIQELDGHKFGYGDKYELPAPKIDIFNTPYGTIKVKP